MPRLGRLIRWAVFLGFLSAVGVGVFHFVRYRPRCVIEGPLTLQHLSPDGSRLITLQRPKGATVLDGSKCGPFQVWDLRSGQAIHDFLNDTDVWIAKCSPTSPHVAALPHDNSLHLIDWASGAERTIKLDGNGSELRFSRKGRWLHGADLVSHSFIDVLQGRTVSVPADEFVCFNKDDHALFAKDEFGPEMFLVEPADRRHDRQGSGWDLVFGSCLQMVHCSQHGAATGKKCLAGFAPRRTMVSRPGI